jgi:hypothetical protein
MVYIAAQPVSGADVAAADELAGPAGPAWPDSRADTGIHEPAREYLRRVL